MLASLASLLAMAAVSVLLVVPDRFRRPDLDPASTSTSPVSYRVPLPDDDVVLYVLHARPARELDPVSDAGLED